MPGLKEKNLEAVRPLKAIPQTASQRISVMMLLPFEFTYMFIYAICIWIRNAFLFYFPGKPKSLANEVILVTGGANGIGREICIQLVKQEKNLTIISWDVNEEKNLETVDTLRALGARKALAYTVDVSDQEKVAIAAAKVRQDAGDVTILFNNAGIDPQNTIGWRKEPKTIKTVFDVNILSHLWTFKEFLPKMIEKKRGVVMETCSVMGFSPFPSSPDYAATKFAIRGYYQSVKEDLRHLPGKNDIFIGTIYPGFVLTNMTAHMDFRMRRYTFLNEVVTPDYVASRVIHGMRHRKAHIYVPQLNIAMRFFIEFFPEEVTAKLFDFAGAPWIPLAESEDCNAVVVHKF